MRMGNTAFTHYVKKFDTGDASAPVGPSSFRVESNIAMFLVSPGQTGGSRLPEGHPKGLALTRPYAPRRSPKGCRPRLLWPTALTAEGDSLPSR